MNSQTQQLSLNLTIAEINAILDALGQRPYAEVFPLVDKIKAQSQAQLQSRPGDLGEENLPSMARTDTRKS